MWFDLIKAGVAAVLHLFLFWNFGSAFVCLFSKTARTAQERIVIGFFLYYALFQVVTLPMMFAQRRLSELAALWGVLVVAACAGSFYIRRKKAGGQLRVLGAGIPTGVWKERLRFWRLAPVLIALVHVALVSAIYSSYWDATYYVGNVSFSVYTDSIGTIDPLTGELLSAFDLRHCLATYHMHDAVVCRLLGLHPLIETKTVMVIVVTIVLNLLYHRFGRFLFGKNDRAVALFMGFSLLVNVCTYTAYTASSFVLLRTYEGKAVTGAITSMFLLYWFLQLSRKEEAYAWRALFVTAWGAAAISSSAWFLVIMSIGVFALVRLIASKRFRELLWCGLCMAPAVAMLFGYLLNRLGLLVIPVRG